MNPEEYIAQRLQDQIDWYDRKSSQSKKSFQRLRLTEIVASALIPFLSGMLLGQEKYRTTGTIIVGALGMGVTIIAGILGLGRHQEQWVEYRATCESLKREKFLFQAGVEPYDGAATFPLLVQRVETLLSKENAGWTQYAMTQEREKAKDKT